MFGLFKKILARKARIAALEAVVDDMTKLNDDLRAALHETIKERDKLQNDADTWRGEVIRLHTKINLMQMERESHYEGTGL